MLRGEKGKMVADDSLERSAQKRIEKISNKSYNIQMLCVLLFLCACVRWQMHLGGYVCVCAWVDGVFLWELRKQELQYLSKCNTNFKWNKYNMRMEIFYDPKMNRNSIKFSDRAVGGDGKGENTMGYIEKKTVIQTCVCWHINKHFLPSTDSTYKNANTQIQIQIEIENKLKQFPKLWKTLALARKERRGGTTSAFFDDFWLG